MGQIHGSGAGNWNNTALVDDTGHLWVGVSGTVDINNITGSIVIGSVSANVDSMYIQSGDNINLGTAWSGVGSDNVNNNIVLDKVRVRDSGIVCFPKDEDRMINGNMYQAGSYIMGMPDGASGGVFLVTGLNDIHFAFDARTDGDTVFEFYENSMVGTTSGVSLPIFNRSRHAAKLGSEIDAELFVDPNLSSDGLMIHSAMFLGGSGASSKFVSATVSVAPQNANWLLEAGSGYYMKFVNVASRPLNADFNIVMHEHGH